MIKHGRWVLFCGETYIGAKVGEFKLGTKGTHQSSTLMGAQ
jgi:hypothetical protein